MKRFLSLLFIILILISYLTACVPLEEPLKRADYEGEVQVHFLDVGQATCQVILLPNGETMMIDAGNNDDKHFILNYLDFLNIDTIDYLVGTHPHEDHIGSLDAVINNFNIGTLFMPKAENNTKSYYDVLDAVEYNSVELVTAAAGQTIYADSDLKINIVAPERDYEDLNNMSIVVHLKYKNSSFLFTGDCEKDSENDIRANIASDVLAVPHHGSSTSSSNSFLNRVDPMYAVISCGEGNDYGHPHFEVLDKLTDDDITIYRTDLNGTIVCTTSGGGPADYTWETQR